MAYGLYAECPHCGLIAYGEEEVERLFGFRYNGTKPQSWCRSCRSSANRDTLNVYDAAEIWLSNGMDEDYTFGYTEEELRKALN